ncbi:hypothetical protein ACIBO5_57950 [Nonomuraea angiospora]|uniref:hypothetical protein n=1 Tax=Nonomuraea angiospora TaxID=46172 RepID=UPI00378D7ABE
MSDQLGRTTIVACSMVVRPGERSVLWVLDARVGMPELWGVPAERFAAIDIRLRSVA